MVFQGLLGLELLAADVALEPALRVVRGEVPLQLTAVSEHLLADVALVPAIKDVVQFHLFILDTLYFCQSEKSQNLQCTCLRYFVACSMVCPKIAQVSYLTHMNHIKEYKECNIEPY